MDENQNNPNQPKAPAEIPVDPPPPEQPFPQPNLKDSLPPIPSDPPPVDPPAIDPPFDPPDPPPLTPPGVDPRANSLPQINEAPGIQTSPPQSEPKKGGSFKKFFVFAFVILLFAIGTASVSLAYTDYKAFSPPKPVKNLVDSIILKTPLPKTPRLILEKTQNQIVNLKTAIVETNVQFSTSAQNFPVKNAQITIKGPIDFKSQEESKMQFDISGSVATEGLQISAAGSIKQIANKLYFKLTEFPAGSFLPLDEIKNQWFVTDIPQVKDNQPDKEISQKLKNVFENFIAKSSNWSQITTDENKDIYKVVIKPPKTEIDNFIFEIIGVLEPQNQNNLGTSIQKDNLGEFTKNLEKVEITMKVRKKDYLPDEVGLSVSLNIQAPPSLFPTGKVELLPQTTIPITFSATSKFTNYNEPVIVEIPQDAKDIKELSKMYESILPKNPQKSIPEILPIPKETTPSASPQKEQSSFRNLLDEKSPVLGEKTTNWDLIILKTLFP